MSIYKKALGTCYAQLHPMLQQRYAFSENRPFTASGVMWSVRVGAAWLYPVLWLGSKFKLLFPDCGTAVPFRIVNTPRAGARNEAQIHWERRFYFGEKIRYFNAMMSLDAKQQIIKDYLGEPSILYSDLRFEVTAGGGLQITSEKQRLVLGKLEIPLPRFLQGLAVVTEDYDEEKDVFQIAVEVSNPLVGLIFAYEGEFKPDASSS